MRIAVASGKGGTGKTTVAVNLALTLAVDRDDVVLTDCDVEAPNVHIFLHPEIASSTPATILIPEVDEEKCTHCGACSRFCAYNALATFPKQVLVFPQLCHGCGGCAIVCPEDAITEVPREIGVVERGESRGIAFVHGRLNISEPMASPLIAQVKATAGDEGVVILDCPPGTACPVIESLKGVDYCLLVTEPTPFGLHDLRIAVDVVRLLEIPFSVVINRDGVGDECVERYCREESISVDLRIPDDRRIAHLYSEGVPFTTQLPAMRRGFTRLFERIGERQ